MATVLKNPDTVKRLASEGAVAVGDSPEEFGAFVRTEIAEWTKLIHRHETVMQRRAWRIDDLTRCPRAPPSSRNTSIRDREMGGCRAPRRRSSKNVAAPRVRSSRPLHHRPGARRPERRAGAARRREARRGFESGCWQGIVTRAGTPGADHRAARTEVVRALNLPGSEELQREHRQRNRRRLAGGIRSLHTARRWKNGVR